MAENRQLSNWIKAYKGYTENTESPESFHVFSSLFALAGSLQRKVWIKTGHFNIFPNLYINLVAPPGKARKTAAIRIASRMLEKIKVPLVADNITREALIQQAAQSEQHHMDSAGMTYTHNSLSLASDEFVVFLGQNNFLMLDLLTDWFDCKSPWSYVTKGSGRDEISGLYLNLIGAATSQGLGSHLPDSAVGGGFTSRFIYVVERDKRKSVAFPELTEIQEKTGEALIEDLSFINKHFAGPMTLTPDAKRFYKEWYDNEDRNKGVTDIRILPYLERKPLHVLKLSISVHAASKNNMEIDEQDIDIAIGLLDSIEPKMSEAFTSLGLNKDADLQERVLEYIGRFKNPVSHDELMRAFWKDAGAAEMKDILTTLDQMGVLNFRTLNGISQYWLKKRD